VRSFARLTPSGGLDLAYNVAIGTAFGGASGGITQPTFLAVLADGRTLAASSFLSFNGAPATGFAVLNPTGTLSVAPTGASLRRELVELALPTRDGKWIVAGRFTRVNGVDRGRIARLNADGSLDATFVPGAGFNDAVSALTAASEGKILVGGSFTSFNGIARGGIVRLLADGSVDTAFNSGTGFSGGPRAIALQPDGRILVGGWFSAYNGTTRNQIARLHADGALDLSFDSGAGPDSSVWAFATQQDGRILIGGMFDSYAGVARKRFARINSDGSLDASFNAGVGFDNYVRAIDVQPDGGVLVCGDFTKFDGGSRSGFARFRPDGSFDWSFNAAQSGGMVYRVQALADGRSFLLGNVLQQGMSTSGVVRVGADGVTDPSFATAGFSMGSTASDMAWADDGRLLVTYATGARDGAQRYGLVLLKPDVSPVPTITASPASLMVVPGDTAGFSVAATGSTLNYRWTKDQAYLVGARQTSLSLPNVQLRDVGYYRAHVSNGGAVATSAEAALNLQSFPIAAPATDQLGLGVAFDGTNFLVAIQGNSGNATAASAQLVAPDGSLVGGRISLGRNGGQAGSGLGAAKVAFDGTNYLVVWADNAAAPQLRLYGAFVSKAGALVGAPFAFPVATGATTMQRPEGIAFNGTRYLVVYSDGESKPWRLCARFVEPAGVIGGEMPLASNMVGSFQSVASNGNSFFVAWPARLAASQHVVQGRLILGDGGMAAPLNIDGTVSPSYNPVSVASDGLDYLVAWNRDTGPGYPAPTEWELRSRFVQRDNTMPGSIVVVQPTGERPAFPGIAFDGANYLVTWTQVHGGGDLTNTTALDVAGRYLQRNGALRGEAFNLVVGAGNQALAPVAVGAGKTLVVYNELGAPFGGSGLNAVRGLLLPASVAPAITEQPVSQTFGAGSMAVMSVTASGGGPAYQWRKDGVDIPGARSATLTLPNVQPGDFGSYSVVVSSVGGSVTSAPALLGVSGVPGTRYRVLDHFFPLVVGNEWLYARSGEVPARSNSRKRITSLDHAITGYTGGAAATPVIQRAVAVYSEYGLASGGGFVADEVWIDYFASNGDALGFYGDDEEGPLAVRGDGSLWFPASMAVGESAVTVGDSYANGVWTGPMSIAFRLLGVETVVTPAGTFVGCLHTRFSFAGDAPDVLNDNWWAPGVGWVRSLKRKAGEVSISEELLISSAVQAPVLPAITAQPAGAMIALGTTAPLGVTANGTAPLSYQWYRGESGDTASPVVGATNASFTTPALTAWARYWVRVANRSASVDSATALVEVTGGTMTVGDWAAQGGVPTNRRGYLDTPAGDGVTNLMKFALGVPPLDDATAHLPTATTYAQSGQPLAVALLFAKNPGAQGVRYALEVSDGLATWTEVAAVLDVLGTNPDGTQLVRLREAVPPAVARRFARLKVELVP
jgi:uncharacterized delta-60 repeat protein